MKSYDAKQRREQRRRNHIAYDLGSSKYRQRIKQSKKGDDYGKWSHKDWLDEFDGD